jgi:hypothetical protein
VGAALGGAWGVGSYQEIEECGFEEDGSEMDEWIFFFIVAVVAVVALIAVASYYQEKQRREQMQAVAERMGFSFSPQGDAGLRERLGHFHLFSQGHSRKMRNVMRREIHGVAVTLFDYQYTTSSSKHNNTHRRTVLLFETERLRLPFFTLRPQGLFHKLAAAFGHGDIDFQAHPSFSDAYLLQGSDESQIRDLFREEVLSYYERRRNLCTEGAGQQLVFYRGNRREEPGSMEGFLEQGLEVLDLFMESEEAPDTSPSQGVELDQAKALDEVLAQLEVEGWE